MLFRSVYSNQPEVELLVNGESLGRKTASDHFFYFEVPNAGESVLTAVAGECRDESRIRKVETFNEEYRMKETGDVINWFDITAPEGYFSINDKLGDIMASFKGKLFFMELAGKLMKKKKSGKEGGAEGFQMSEGMAKMMGSFTVKRMLNMLGTAGLEPLTAEEILEINRKLNKIRKKE